MRHVALPCCLALALLPVTSARGQAPAAVATPPAAAIPAAAPPTVPAVLSKWLRNLTVAEEAYYAQHDTYTTDVLALGLLPDLRGRSAADSVQVRVVFAGGEGWSAVATHRAHRGKSCVAFVGDPVGFPKPPATEADGTRATAEGLPVCDRF